MSTSRPETPEGADDLTRRRFAQFGLLALTAAPSIRTIRFADKQVGSNPAPTTTVLGRFGLSDRATLICADRTAGRSRAALLELARAGDLLVNISGNLADREVKDAIRTRAYVDIDPGYTQYWEAAGVGGARLDGHEYHFTIAPNIGHAHATAKSSTHQASGANT